MLIGYVSDERFVALADVLVEFERDGRCAAVVRSTPRGGVGDGMPGRRSTNHRCSLATTMAVPPESSGHPPHDRGEAMTADMLLQELTREETRAIAQEAVAVFPVGATEQHGPHLPVGTDAFA
ncbi:MAG TPA: creatininase family protein, partial [Thermomicrobiales bacterium]|nr:creatininase family protein [Thermomicrobiales bacterium]